MDSGFGDYQSIRELKKVTEHIIAKTGQSESGKGLLPFWMHALDTAGVLRELYERRIPQSTRESFSKACGSDEKAVSTFVLAGLVHDLGKATSAFQAQIYRAGHFAFGFPVDFMDQIRYGNGGRKNPHSLLGEIILRYEGFEQAFASVAGAHHGMTQDGLQECKPGKLPSALRTDLRGTKEDEGFWTSIWSETVWLFLQLAGFSKPEDVPELDCTHLMVLTGLVSQADWIASNTEYFPLIESLDEAKADLYPGRIETGWAKIALPERWICTEDFSFEDLFGFSPRPFQSAVIDCVENMKEPGLILIEAPMGLGKTETALMAASQLSYRLQTGGAFIGLPTQATANGLLPRFFDWSSREAGDQAVTFKLSHSAAGLNEMYNSLPDAPVNTNSDDEQPAHGGKSSHLYVHSWMNSSKLSLFSDFVIGTVDQALMSGLDHRYVTLRHAGLAGKILLLDEVHSYDTYMSRYMEKMLEWMGAYHTPVILMSATLSRTQKNMLISSYLKGHGMKKSAIRQALEKTDTGDYPVLTWTERGQVCMHALPYIGDHLQVKADTAVCKDLQQELEEIVNALDVHLSQGGCAGIVVNTIQTAQQVYEHVKQHLEGEIVLIHSGYTGTDRRKKEQWILDHVGKSSDARMRDRVIVIGTQVIEQSLDIDFDYMISELAPMDLLLQRMGRLHRHPNRTRPEKLSVPEMLVLRPESVTDRTMKTVYSEWLLYRTMHALPASICLPDDISELVNKTYADPDVDSLRADEKRLYEQRLIHDGNRQAKADSHVLSSPNTGRLAYLGVDGLMKEQAIRSPGTAENAVRDIEPSLNVILLMEADDEIVSPDTESFEDKWILSRGGCPVKPSQILAKKIRVPGIYDLDRAEAEVRNRMDNSRIRFPEVLRDELFVLLDENREFELCGQMYRYSWESGITRLEKA